VVFGSVGLSAIVPALQAAGHEVLAVPTVLLSNHPGLGKPQGNAVDIATLLAGADAAGGLAAIDAVITGYFANPAQVHSTAELIARLHSAHVLVDPVLGDNARLYVPEDIAIAIRDQLLPLASIATPNAFELAWLTSRSLDSGAAIAAAARKLAVPEVLVTSARVTPEAITTTLVTDGEAIDHTMTTFARVPNGTGDFLAGQYLGARLLQPAAQAFHDAMARLEQAISLSVGRRTLDLAPHQLP
jgi:pyridoxine kinase